MMVLGHFLKRRIAPLQQRTRMAYMYTGSNECCRIARGPGTDFSRAELEVAIRGMTGDAFSPESLVLPSRVKALCEDQALRASVLSSRPTLDEGGLAVRQLGGDPNRGRNIPDATSDRQQRPGAGLHCRAATRSGVRHARPPGDRRVSSCPGDGRVYPYLLPEPRPRHPTNSHPGWSHPGDGGRHTGGSAGGGRHGGVPHPTPSRTCKEWERLRTTRTIGLVSLLLFL
jgi:hypothetical protein